MGTITSRELEQTTFSSSYTHQGVVLHGPRGTEMKCMHDD